MLWVKKGLVYGPDGSVTWAQHSALTPTPIQLEPDKIRVYAGFRDSTGVSRIGYVDVAADNPAHVLRVCARPVLDIGAPGAFDDNGVILGDVLMVDDTVWMYYVGFQQVQKVKFLAFSGLAVSRDRGESFERFSRVPILDRGDEALFIRAIHSVLIEDGRWRAWYASGSGWETIGGVSYPQYHIRYIESPDGMSFRQPGTPCLRAEGSEYRIGRPRVYKDDRIYRMYFTKGDTQGHYFPGYAESLDGIHWIRKDAQIGLTLSASGWDSRTLCYPALISAHGRTYMFYNGNDMGRDGFGYAEAMP
jgi:hypothetical protein